MGAPETPIGEIENEKKLNCCIYTTSTRELNRASCTLQKKNSSYLIGEGKFLMIYSVKDLRLNLTPQSY